MDKCIAIIPARGGSKRIPRKNIKNFLGKPIITWVIEKLAECNLFDQIIVTTDDSEIAEIAQKKGVSKIIKRPEHLSDDYTPTLPVITHAIKSLYPKKIYPEYACCVYPCSIFIFKEDIIKGFEILNSKGVEFVYPIAEYPHPIQRALKMNSDRSLEFIFPEYELTRTQDLDRRFHDTGQFYWGKTRAWLERKKMHSNGSGFRIPNWRTVDIDNEDDWIRAEMLYDLILKNNN